MSFKKFYLNEGNLMDKVKKLIDTYSKKHSGNYISGGGKLGSQSDDMGDPYIVVTGKKAADVGYDMVGDLEKLGVKLGRYGATKAKGYMIPITSM